MENENKPKRVVKVYAEPVRKEIYCGRKTYNKNIFKKKTVDKIKNDKIKISNILKEGLSILRYRYAPLMKPSELIVKYCEETKKKIPRPEKIADFIQSIYTSSRCKILNKKNKLRYFKPKKERKSKDKVKAVKSFYMSDEWRKLRLTVLRKHGRVCMKCKSTKNIHVDHIKPRSLHPHLELVFDNCQVLCKMCNEQKSNKHCTDYRPKD